MRVLQIGKFYPPANGGMEQVVHQLAEGLRSSAGVYVLVANTAPRTVHENHQGIQVIRVAQWGQAWSLPICPTLPYWINRLPADLVLLHVPNPLAMWSFLKYKTAVGSIVWLHSEVVRQRLMKHWYQEILHACLVRAQTVVVSSPALLELPSLQPFHRKCRLIPYGIDAAQFALTPSRAHRRDEIRRRYGGPLLLFVGRLTYYKGLSYLLDAVAGLDASLLIVGSGPKESALRRQIRRLNLEERVHLLGSVDHETLAACYHACELFVLPSIAKSEAFGLVQLEAMAAAKPVIGTLLPTGVPWVNQDGMTGLVVPPRDSRALAWAISRLLQDDELRQRLGRQAKQRVETDFTVQRMVKQTWDLIHSMQSSDTVSIHSEMDLGVHATV